MTDITEIRRFYASMLAAQAGVSDPRIEQAFASVPRENFVGPGPWRVVAGGHLFKTPSDDPAHLYHDILVSLDADKGINNGEPLLHAMWMSKVALQPGESVCHVGAGSGYYSAILSLLVSPGGTVTAIEIEPELTVRAARNLAPYANVKVVHGDATTLDLLPSNVIYVNAGLAVPPLSWLESLKPGGRLIFPWRPKDSIGLAVLVREVEGRFACEAFMNSWFIPCSGVGQASSAKLLPTRETATRIRSLWRTAERRPDESAVAIFDDLWFSSSALP